METTGQTRHTFTLTFEVTQQAIEDGEPYTPMSRDEVLKALTRMFDLKREMGCMMDWGDPLSSIMGIHMKPNPEPQLVPEDIYLQIDNTEVS